MKRAGKTLSFLATAASLLSVGSAGATSISNTGPWSWNSVHNSYTNNSVRTNVNTVSIWNSNYQVAQSGNATVWGNTWGGSAFTGNVTNNNSANFWVNIRN